MAHCPFGKLQDLNSELARIRELPGLKEPKPGIFYFKSTPFLHFHEKDGERWADAKIGKDWGPPIEIPFAASAPLRARFLKEVVRRHGSMMSPKA